MVKLSIHLGMIKLNIFYSKKKINRTPSNDYDVFSTKNMSGYSMAKRALKIA